ncbi:MAG: hypothetical protein EBY28_21590 [Betaproteobacteria bacterium]|nr:hypothetical protein [Betaproteobacteria bacterium]
MMTDLWHSKGLRWSLLLALLLHLLLAAAFHLSPDEAHYALYASRLDWSYFDHPPLVGWIQWPAVALGGADVVLRVVPMACWCAAVWGLLRLCESLYPAPQAASSATAADPLLATPSPAGGVAVLALGLWLLSPLPHLLGLALVPDSLLLALTCPIMLLTWRLCRQDTGTRWSCWLALGLCLGLAGLAKYTAILLGLGCLLALLRAHGLRLFSRAGPWLAAVLALAMVSPVLLWNASHAWISFAYQLNHASGSRQWLAWRVLLFVLVQALCYGLLPAVGLWAAWWSRGQGAAAVAPSPVSPRLTPLGLCLCFGLPPLMLYAYLSGRGTTLPHWSVSAWLALLPAAAAGLAKLCASQSQRSWRLVQGLAAWQVLGCAAMIGLMLMAGLGTETREQALGRPGELVDGAPRNPVADLYGWDAAAAQARTLAQAQGVTSLAVMNWSLASRLAWYARPMPVRVVNRHFDQFDLWFGSLQPGDSVLLVDWSMMSFVPPVGLNQFSRCELLAQQPVMHWGRQIAHFNFLLCQQWQGPSSALLGQGPARLSPA